VFSEGLASVSDAGVIALSHLLTSLGLLSIAGREEAVLDFDSTALVCFGTQEGAKFGYCGKGRNRRRHHPLVASVAETRAVVHATYRDGSGIDEKEAIAFMREAHARVREKVTGTISMRADAGFWSKAMGTWLLEQGIPFAFAMPLLASLKLLLMKVSFKAVATEPLEVRELLDAEERPDEERVEHKVDRMFPGAPLGGHRHADTLGELQHLVEVSQERNRSGVPSERRLAKLHVRHRERAALRCVTATHRVLLGKWLCSQRTSMEEPAFCLAECVRNRRAHAHSGLAYTHVEGRCSIPTRSIGTSGRSSRCSAGTSSVRRRR
jgi:hypothetical protein